MNQAQKFFKSYQDLNSDGNLGLLQDNLQLVSHASIESRLSVGEENKLRRECLVQNFKKYVNFVKTAITIYKQSKEKISSQNIKNKTLKQQIQIALEISDVKPNLRNQEQIDIIFEILKEIPYFQRKKDISILRQYCKYAKIKQLNALDFVFVSGAKRNPLNVLWKGEVVLFKPKNAEIFQKFERIFQKNQNDLYCRDKPVNILQNIYTFQKAVKNFQKPIKRLSLETQHLFRSHFSLIQCHSQNQNVSNTSDNNIQNAGFSQNYMHQKNHSIMDKQEKAKKGVLLKRAQIVVNEIKKNIQINEKQVSLDKNCDILSYFYEQSQAFDKFNHQFVQMIEQGKLITDEVNYENKYDPSAVRSMSAMVSHDNTYIITIDYQTYQIINQKNKQFKQKLRAKNIFIGNGFQEKQTMKFLKAAVNNSKIIRFQKNDYIYHQNEEPQYFYYLLKGELQVCLKKQNKRIQLLQIQEFSSFGDSNALNKQPYSHSTLCLNYCKALAIEISVLVNLLKHKNLARKELITKSNNLNNYIDSRIQAYSDSKRDLSFKGDIIYQKPLMPKKQGQISFNDFNDILNQFGGENIAQSQRNEKLDKSNKNLQNNLNQYLVKFNKLQKSQSEHCSIKQEQERSQKQDKKINNQNQCTVELKNKTVRSLYYDQMDDKQKGQSKLDQLIQMSFHLGYKNTHQINKLNKKALKNKYDVKPSNSLIQNPFYKKDDQKSRHKIQQFDIRRRFDNYTFRLDKSERSSSSQNQSNRKKVLQFLEGHSQRSDVISDSCDSIQQEKNNSLKRSQSNKTLNIHTQIKKQINNFITPREQKEFKNTLQFYSNQQRIQNESFMQENANQYFQSPISQIIQNSQENLLQLIKKPHQTELRKRISSFVKQQSQIKNCQKQPDPQLRIVQSSLSQRQNKLKKDSLWQSPQFNATQSQISQIQKNNPYQINLDNTSDIQYFKCGQSTDGDSQDYSYILQIDKTNKQQTEQNKTQISYFLRKSYSEKSNQFLKNILNNGQKKFEKSVSKNTENNLKKDEQLNEILNISNIFKINQSNNLRTQDSLLDDLKTSQQLESPKKPKGIQINNIK
ncbi:hypothetical protein ABPG72_001828 [Tetrahymena utriculariae]